MRHDGVKRIQHRLGRRRRREQAVPGDGADVRVADFLHGRDIGVVGQARVIDHGQRAEFSRLHHAGGAADVEERGLHVAAQHVLNNAGGAVLVRQGGHVEIAGALGEIGHVVMRIGAVADRAVLDLARVLLGVIDQLGHRFDRKIIGGRHQQERRHVDQVGHRGDALRVVEGEFALVDDRRDGVGRDVADHQRVAVGRRFRQFVDC